MRRTLGAGAALIYLFLGPVPAHAHEEPAPVNEPVDRPVARAVRVTAAPTLDGEVLADPAWAAAPVATGFRQTSPDEGEPATERTEIRILYTEDTLYVGVVCFDREPDGIIVANNRRDSSLTETDSFQIILDTYRDRQNGFVFGTNPSGMQYDGQVVKEGQGGGLGGRGAGGGFNINWDGSWEVQAKRSDIGWSAEFAIPFNTLRFPLEPVQTWGLNFQRNLRRRNETSFWAPLPRQFNLFRLSMAGTLTDLEVSDPRNLKLIPYVSGEAFREGVAGAERHTQLDAGLDLKYSITPGITLDATVNTDFAQVEVDEQQINLNRFSLFFPEKRPFFLENAGLFAVGVPQEVEMFFSRRIGLGPDGEEVPILAGVRLSGKAGRTGIGFLNMQTGEEEGVADSENYTVARVNREFGRRSSIGALFTNRQATGDQPPADDYNRLLSVDGRLGIGKNGELSGYAASSFSPDLDRDEYSWRLASRYNSEEWFLNAAFTEVGEGFNPEVGFLARTAYRNVNAIALYRYRPESFGGLQELRPHISYNGFWNFDGFHETGFLHIDNHFEWKNGNEIHTGINQTREGVTDPFDIVAGATITPGTYDNWEFRWVSFTNRGAPFSVRLDATVGGFFGGDRVRLNPSLQLRTGGKFIAEAGWDRNDVDLPGGTFVTNLGVARLSYSFNPKVFLQSLFQYNNVDDLWSANLRFGWLQTANIGLFVVYNETRGIGSGGPPIPDRSLTIKISRQFDLLR